MQKCIILSFLTELLYVLIVGVKGYFCTWSLSVTLGRTPLDEESARRRDLYLTTNNIHNRQTAMPPAGFFFCLSGVFSLFPHVTLRSMLPSLQQTQHKQACPRWDRTHDPSKRAAEDPRLRPHGHWDRPFESTFPASEWPPTYALDRAATGVGKCILLKHN
jgi:hypothetical protein